MGEKTLNMFLRNELNTELHAKCKGYKTDKGWQTDMTQTTYTICICPGRYGGAEKMNTL